VCVRATFEDDQADVVAQMPLPLDLLRVGAVERDVGGDVEHDVELVDDLREDGKGARACVCVPHASMKRQTM
jgi:hypothetical protein